MVKLLTIAVLAALATGCRHAPLSYQLQGQGRSLVLIPPVPAASAEINIAKARKAVRPRTGCDIEGEIVSVQWHGRAARVQFKSTQFIAVEADPRLNNPMYTDSLKSLEDFRSALVDRETKGCLRGDEGGRLLKTIAERFPLPPMIAYYLRFGTVGHAGYFDLTPDFRVMVVSPGTGGADIAYYAAIPAPKDDRVRIVLTSESKRPVSFPDSFVYVRLLFWTLLSSANHYATVLTAPDKTILAEATRRFQAESEGSCESAIAAGATCKTLPANFALNPELRVRVNGRETFVPLGATVRAATGREIPKTLQVRRLFQGRSIAVKFDPANRNIFELVLMPGDEVLW